jgi:hypothetical protein
VKEFAQQHGLRTKRDECDELYIPAKRGQIFDYCDGRFGVMVLKDTVLGWGYARKALERAGFEITQDGDEEGTGLFNPEDAKQAKIAFKVVQPYRKKAYSQEAIEKMRERLRKVNSARQTTIGEASQGANFNRGRLMSPCWVGNSPESILGLVEGFLWVRAVPTAPPEGVRLGPLPGLSRTQN